LLVVSTESYYDARIHEYKIIIIIIIILLLFLLLVGGWGFFGNILKGMFNIGIF